MSDPTDFKRGQVVGTLLVGASVIKTAELFRIARSTVSKVKTAFEKEGKTSLWKRKLSDRDCRSLTRIIWKDHKKIVPKITVELDDHLEDLVSSITE